MSFAGIIYTNPATVSTGPLREHNDLAYLGEQVGREITLRREFKLSRDNVNPSTLRVYVDGELVEHSYDAETNTVHIEELGRDGSEIKINFCERIVPPPGPTPTPTPKPTPEPIPDPEFPGRL